MKVENVLNWLNAIAPFDTAESFDNVGLLLGNPGREVHRVLFALDITLPMVEEAKRLGADLLIAHHPFIFQALKRLDYESPQGKTFLAIAGSNLQVIAAHTNWDQAKGGVGDTLAKTLGLQDVTPLDGYVRVGNLPEPLSREAFEALVKEKLHVQPRLLGGDQPIQRVAVAGGSYGAGAPLAAEDGADAYVVGEIRHKEILDALARGLRICDAGHYATEYPGAVALYERYLADGAEYGLTAPAHLFTVAPY